MAVELPPGYHLTNFLSLLRFVRHQYDDLLTPEEKEYCDVFEGLSRPAQSLYVRLILRKGPVFRSDKLSYPDIPDVLVAAGELATVGGQAGNGYLSYAADQDELLGLLTKGELVRCLADRTGVAQLRREDVVQKVKTQTGPAAWQPGFTVLRPLGEQQLLLYRLLFFGNLSQDFTEFVLTDMGMLRYEDYRISADVRFFDSRNTIEQSWAIYALRDQCDELISAGEFDQLAEVMVNTLSTDFDASGTAVPIERRRDQLFNHAARHLERQQLTAQALRIYEHTSLPPARERRARILSNAGDHRAAFELCEEMVDHPWDETELEFATGFGHRLARKLGVTPGRVKPTLNYESIHLEVGQQVASELGVEEAARLWFEAQGKESFYVENSLVPGVFGLCFWDVIFQPIKGAFINPFQRGPLDLFTPLFRTARNDQLAMRLQELTDRERLRQRLQETYQAKNGTANYFVNWNILTPRLVSLVMERIPLEHLQVMFGRLLFDLKNNRSGFPDLVVFDGTNQVGSYEMIEVKGPNDQLQNNQKRWIRFFADNGIPFRLARVAWTRS